MDFPTWLYKRHSTESFVCPSQEFFDNMKEKQFWQETPWLEPEKKTAEELKKAYPKLEAENERLTLIIKTFEEETKIKNERIADLKTQLKFAKKGL